MNHWKVFVGAGLVLVLFMTPSVFAQGTSSSSSYRVDEYFIGPGGSNDLNSTNYNARASLGDTGVGNSASANYQLYGGFTTTNDAHLELIVDAAVVDFGTLTPDSTATGSATFSVRNYLSSGYSITTSSPPPTNEDGYSMNPIGSAASSVIGTEQFGMNLVANTAPATFGAAPAQIPSASFSYGAAASGYATTNAFQYNDQDIVATSDQATGRTDYTISYIMNISPNTPGGLYTMKHFIVATPTF